MEPSAEATVVSLLPFKIKSEKPTLDPGLFEIDAAPYDGIAILQVGISRYRPYFGAHAPALMVPELGGVIARSIVDDYINATPCVDGENRPGLFHLRNRLTADQVVSKYRAEIEEAREIQNRWFWRLVQLADDTYPHQGHRSVMKIQREAAKAVGHLAAWNKPDHIFIERLIQEGKVKVAALSQ